MHAIVITFTSSVDPDQLQASMAEYADQLSTMPGFIAKTWLRDGNTLGGSYLFGDRASADAYLDGPLVAALRGNPSFSGFEVRRYDVIDELTTRTWSAPPAAA
jgi:hypothetical protein